jgi:hypothetical protein
MWIRVMLLSFAMLVSVHCVLLLQGTEKKPVNLPALTCGLLVVSCVIGSWLLFAWDLK